MTYSKFGMFTLLKKKKKFGVFISQQNYVMELLKETGKLAWKPTSTSIDTNHKLECYNPYLWITLGTVHNGISR